MTKISWRRLLDDSSMDGLVSLIEMILESLLATLALVLFLEIAVHLLPLSSVGIHADLLPEFFDSKDFEGIIAGTFSFIFLMRLFEEK